MNILRDIESGVAQIVAKPALDGLLSLAARVMLSFIFIMAGYSKIGGYEGTQGYMEAMGVPGAMLPLVILLELGGGLALLIGLQTRLMAAALAGFCVISGVLFHGGEDQMQQILLMKNIAIAGGLLALVRTGAGRFGVDKV
ncbi:MAG: DoxX family protein [Moraxellaceae bacterium]|nr:DoxX family protein [Moraxellaceae bacterium]MDP1776469.1 DoxX family protein [Moraxellaceae bacterium]MDZ4298911.1 DoxX family protein [Moraxellaceae bacterium]MDZ4387672.1 DoxX family protein [Moraxellaceae bacterium]